jgi:outer membrane protein assembly factor BamB
MRANRVNLGGARIFLYATLALLLVTPACFLPTGRVWNVPPGEWTGALGGAARTPYLDEHVPADPSIVWERRFGRGYTDIPSIDDSLIIASNTAKSVTIANAVTGKRIWERRLHGAVVGALLRKNDRIYAVTQSRDGRVEALTVTRGAHAWNAKLNAPAAGGAVLVDSVIYAGNLRGELFALSAADGHRMWRVRLTDPLATSPVAWRNDLIVITNADSMLRIDRATGSVSAGIKLAGSSSADVALHGDVVLVTTHPGVVQAVHLPDLRIDWSAPLGSPILAAPALDGNGDAYVLTRAADVWRISATGAATRIAQLGGAATESLTLTADGLLVGRLDGSVLFLHRDGTTVWQRSFTHSVRAPVAVSNGAAYVPLGDGRMVMLK